MGRRSSQKFESGEVTYRDGWDSGHPEETAVSTGKPQPLQERRFRVPASSLSSPEYRKYVEAVPVIVRRTVRPSSEE